MGVSNCMFIDICVHPQPSKFKLAVPAKKHLTSNWNVTPLMTHDFRDFGGSIGMYIFYRALLFLGCSLLSFNFFVVVGLAPRAWPTVR